MLLYLTVGSNDLQRSQKFYDVTLATIGLVRSVTDDSELGYGPSKPLPHERARHFYVVKPVLELPATWGNGTMVAFAAPTRKSVDAFHAAALASGGTDEGSPGLRPYSPNFYAAYVRDPDGNKLSAVCETAE